MLIKIKKKGVSLIEALVAMFLLGMITLFYFNSSTTYMSSQQKLVKVDRHEQVAELILQGIMEYTKQNSSVYGTMTSDDEQVFTGTTDTLNINIFQVIIRQSFSLLVTFSIVGLLIPFFRKDHKTLQDIVAFTTVIKYPNK
jgi:hypothetical protein